MPDLPEPYEMEPAVNRPRVTVKVNRYGEVVIRLGGTSGYFTTFEAKVFAGAILERIPAAQQVAFENAEDARQLGALTEDAE